MKQEIYNKYHDLDVREQQRVNDLIESLAGDGALSPDPIEQLKKTLPHRIDEQGRIHFTRPTAERTVPNLIAPCR